MREPREHQGHSTGLPREQDGRSGRRFKWRHKKRRPSVPASTSRAKAPDPTPVLTISAGTVAIISVTLSYGNHCVRQLARVVSLARHFISTLGAPNPQAAHELWHVQPSMRA
eukprot:3576040-Pleurochrysis_carterae.AAC.1